MLTETRHRIMPWIVCLLTAAVYLAFPTRVYYWDGIAFAQAIEDASGLNVSLVHPNHLIYNFAGYLFYKLLLALGLELRAVTALQILNSLFSAACAGVLFVILRATLRSLYLSVCLTVLFAFSATWWRFSTDANAYIPSAFFLLIAFYMILPNRKPRPLLLALTYFLSMAFHQLAVVMFPVLVLGVYLQDGAISLKQRVLNAVYFCVVTTALIATTYGYLFYLATRTFDLARLMRWTASYSRDADTSFNVWSNLQYSLRGQVRLFLGGRFNLVEGIVNPLVVMLMIALAVAVILLIFETFRNLRKIITLGWVRELQLEAHQKTLLLLSVLWATVYLVFLLFWLPQNTFYRLFYLPALILLFGLGLAAFRNGTSRPRRFTAVFVIAVALANFIFLIYPFSHVQKYPPLAFALQMNQPWPAGTVIYYAAENSDKGLVRYFNPSTRWKILRREPFDVLAAEITDIYSKGGTAWFETTAIDQFASTPEGARWLEMHARKESLKELNDGAYEMRFIQVEPQ